MKKKGPIITTKNHSFSVQLKPIKAQNHQTQKTTNPNEN
jgi:hypothetical protein